MSRMKLTRFEVARLREVHNLPPLAPAPATVPMQQSQPQRGGRGPRHYRRERAGLPARAERPDDGKGA